MSKANKILGNENKYLERIFFYLRMGDYPTYHNHTGFWEVIYITSGEYTHEGSMKCLLGDDPDPKLLEKMSLEDQVTDDAPQAFIWHTSEDGLVPLENSLFLAEALHKKGKNVEMHIYPKGGHGLSLCDDTVSKKADLSDDVKYCSEWIGHCIRWIKEIL